MKKYHILVETKNGVQIVGEEHEITDDELVKLKETMTHVLSGSGGGYVSVDVGEDTTWIPLRSIDHVDLLCVE